jgi:hypothetical protein
MNLLQQLVSDWVGLLSLITVVAAIAIVAFIATFLLRRM